MSSATASGESEKATKEPRKVEFLPICMDALALIRCADERIAFLHQFFSAYAEKGISVTVELVDADKPSYSQVFRVKADELPFPLEIFVGEVIRNLRAALDYTLCAMATDRGATAEVLRQCYFPITGSDNQLANAVKSKVTDCGLDGLAQFFLTELRPTPTGNKALCDLNEIDRQNKHRALPVTLAVISAALPNWCGASGNIIQIAPGGDISVGIPRELYFENGAQLERRLELRFGQIPVFAGHNVVRVLRHLFEATLDAVDELQNAYRAAYLADVAAGDGA